jgi:RecB family exonuclease
MIRMGFNINSQTGGVVNNVEGNQYIRGDQRNQMVVHTGAAREAVRELERSVASIGIPDAHFAGISGYIKEINKEVSRPHPEPEKVANALKKIMEIASAAGALASLAGPIQSLVTWLGPLGQPIAKLLSGM